MTVHADNAQPLFTIYHLLFTLQESFRRVHADELTRYVYPDADALGERDEVFSAVVVADDEDGRFAAGVEHLEDRAQPSAPDRLDAAPFELPVVERALFERDRFRLGHGQLAARERGGLFRRVKALELQDDAVAVRPLAFELEPAALAVGEDRDQLREALEAFGEVGQKVCRDLAAQPARVRDARDGDQLDPGQVQVFAAIDRVFAAARRFPLGLSARAAHSSTMSRT